MIGVDLMFNGDALIVMGIRLKMRYNYTYYNYAFNLWIHLQ